MTSVLCVHLWIISCESSWGVWASNEANVDKLKGATSPGYEASSWKSSSKAYLLHCMFCTSWSQRRGGRVCSCVLLASLACLQFSRSINKPCPPYIAKSSTTGGHILVNTLCTSLPLHACLAHPSLTKMNFQNNFEFLNPIAEIKNKNTGSAQHIQQQQNSSH